MPVGIGRRERILARSALAGAVLVTLTAVLWAALPVARWTFQYFKRDLLMLNYRNAILLQAQAAIEQGDLEVGSARLREFGKLFPDYLAANRIDERVATLNARSRAAAQLDRQADLLERRFGTSASVLSLRTQALRLHAGDERLREKVQRSADALRSYAENLPTLYRPVCVRKYRGEGIGTGPRARWIRSAA